MTVASDALMGRSPRQSMPLLAVVLAVLIHLAAGAGIWFLASTRPVEPPEDPIMVLFDTSPSNRGLQAPERPGPPPPSDTAGISPEAERPPPSPPSAEPQPPAMAAEGAQPLPATPELLPTLPLFEFSIPPPIATPPPPSTQDYIRSWRPLVRPTQRPPDPRPAVQAQQRPPAEQPAAMPAPLPGPDPADTLAGRGRIRNDYLSKLFRHLEPYRAGQLRGQRPHGRVVTRVVVGRDGSLLDVSLVTPSGDRALDAAELAALRRASPFPAIPPGMPGDPIVLILPITY